MHSAMHDVAKQAGTLHPCIRLRHEIMYEYWKYTTVNENTIIKSKSFSAILCNIIKYI